MNRYELKKNLKDRLNDGSVLMLIAATVAILFMNAHQAASAAPGDGTAYAGVAGPAVAGPAVAGESDSGPVARADLASDPY